MKMPAEEYRQLIRSNEEWECGRCELDEGNNNMVQNEELLVEDGDENEEAIKWGDLRGATSIKSRLKNMYERIVTWQKNFFETPRGQAGESMIKEMARLIQLFNNETLWEKVSIMALHVFVPLMLQKPSAKSKKKDHMKYLTKRLDWWKSGNLEELIQEGEEIQRRMKNSPRKEKSDLKGFTRLMLEGKVKQALKLIDENNGIVGVHKLTDSIKDDLEAKHPDGQDTVDLNDHLAPDVQEVIFEEITSETIVNAARNTSGSGGPTKVDAEIWRKILCSKFFTNASNQLAEEIAKLARRLCVDEIPFNSISTLMACRLVPLKKEDDGVRPVGIGEVLRRLIGKSVTRILKEDIQKASGTLQTCSGLESGIDAAVHAMKMVFDQDWCEAVLLVDAENAFTKLNRKVALSNTKSLCPPFFRYLNNSYQEPSKLYLSDGSYIMSKEGVTQGDNTAMAMYAIGVRPLIN